MKAITLLVALLCFGTIGCKTQMAPGGAYSDRPELYQADLVITMSYDVLHRFVQWELQNRASLVAYPEIKKAADKVRLEAPGLINSAVALRDVYAASGSSGDLVSLEVVVSLLRQMMTETVKHLSNHSTL